MNTHVFVHFLFLSLSVSYEYGTNLGKMIDIEIRQPLYYVTNEIGIQDDLNDA